MRARILVLLLVLTAGAVHAAGPRAVREQAEMSMLVTGMVLVAADGSVSGWEIDQREKLPDYVVNLVERSAPVWKFEPTLVDGRPHAVKARMSLRLVAEKLDNDNYRIAISNGYFGREALDSKARRALDREEAPTDRVASRVMRPPGYPETALQMGARGTVDANWQVSPTAAMRLNVMASQGDVAGRNGVAILTREEPLAVRSWGAGALVRRPGDAHVELREPGETDVLARELNAFAIEGRYLEVDLADRPLTVASLYLPKGGLPAHLQEASGGNGRDKPDGGAKPDGGGAKPEGGGHPGGAPGGHTGGHPGGGPTGEGDTPAPVAMSAELWSYEPAGGSSGS